MEFLLDCGTPSVAIIGFGYVGSTIGAVLTESGLQVTGIDVDELLIEELRAGYCRFNEPDLPEALNHAREAGRLSLSTDLTSAREADVIIITVGTPIDRSRAIVTTYIEKVCQSLAPILRSGHLVMVKSTVAPGTTNGIVRDLLEESGLRAGRDFGLAFCPERFAEGSAMTQFRTLPIVVGGCDDVSAEAARRFWSSTLHVAVEVYERPEVAELIKLADNLWIDVNIALGNELAQFCEPLGVDVLDVISGANSLPKGDSFVNILLPSVGVGGSCLTKDPWILWSQAGQHGVRMPVAETAREVNDAMPFYTYKLIRDGLARLGKGLAESKVTVLGTTYKNNTNDLRDTPVRPVIEALRKDGARVSIYDPLVAADSAEAEFDLTPASSLQDAVACADCVAILAGHAPFQNLDFTALAGQVAMPCLILDGRAYYSRKTIASLRAAGFAYQGIGRPA